MTSTGTGTTVESVGNHKCSRHCCGVGYHEIMFKFVISASTIMFCCIMFKAMFVVVKCVDGHIRVGPKTIAILATAIRLTSL